MLDEQPVAERVHEQPHAGHHCQERCQQHRVLHGGLAPAIGYKPLMPEAMAFHSSSSLGRNTVMAKIAITTKTQVSQ